MERAMEMYLYRNAYWVCGAGGSSGGIIEQT